MKKCFKCGINKPISEYYKHKKMADGHLNKCKECTKKDVKNNRDDNIEYYRDYDAWRFQNDPKVKERHQAYSLTDGCKKSSEISRVKWASGNPNKRAAHIILGNAVRDGKIVKPEVCSDCGSWTPSRRLHAHHNNYDKPLDVVWMCVDCHSEHHHPKNNDFTPIRA